MSILDAARRLDFTRPVRVGDVGQQVCVFCFGEDDSDDYGNVELHHAPNCPWLAMPKIVAALEAAERMMQEDPTEGDCTPRPGQCKYCESETYPASWTWRLVHAKDCPWQALEVALANDEKAEVLTGPLA